MKPVPYDILGVDPSLAAVGVAHLRCYIDGPVALVRNTTLYPRPKALSGEAAAHSLADSLAEWLCCFWILPNWAFRESQPPPLPGRASGALMRAFGDGALARVIHVLRPGLRLEPLNPRTWRARLGIKTHGLKTPEIKDRCLAHARGLFPDSTILSHDAAEAALVALAGWRELEEEFRRE